MNTVQLENPWKVESIQNFSCLKCPECTFFTKEEKDFEIHAIANHPLSAALFDKTMVSSEIIVTEKEEVLDDVCDFNVFITNKDSIVLNTSEDDPFDFKNTNIQEHGTHFMSSLTRYDSSVNRVKEAKEQREILESQVPENKPKKRSSINEPSLNPVNQPKKMKMASKDFDNGQIDVLNDTNKPKEQISKYKPKKRKMELETEDPFTSNNKAQKKQRRRKISENNNLEEEKEEQIQPKQLTLMQFIFRQMWPDFY
jgi:hypothetical protein